MLDLLNIRFSIHNCLIYSRFCYSPWEIFLSYNYNTKNSKPAIPQFLNYFCTSTSLTYKGRDERNGALLNIFFFFQTPSSLLISILYFFLFLSFFSTDFFCSNYFLVFRPSWSPRLWRPAPVNSNWRPRSGSAALFRRVMDFRQITEFCLSKRLRQWCWSKPPSRAGPNNSRDVQFTVFWLDSSVFDSLALVFK